MLVLTRKLSEKIQVGDNITISVLKVKGNTVRLGIEAPRDVHIKRGELPPKSEEFGDETDAEEEETSPRGGTQTQQHQPLTPFLLRSCESFDVIV